MANANEIIRKLLFEDGKKSKEIVQKKTLKIFYNIDIFVKQEDEDKMKSSQPVQQAQNATPTPAPVPTQQIPQQAPLPAVQAPAPLSINKQESIEFKKNTKRLLLREDEDIDKEKTGVIDVSQAEVDNIQTMEDLVSFLTDKKKKNGEPIFNEFISELILTLSGSGEIELSDLLKKEDKILIDVDYGEEKTDSVGFKILKRPGVKNISIMLKKDSNILPGKFDISDFNNQLIIFRNDIIGSDDE